MTAATQLPNSASAFDLAALPAGRQHAGHTKRLTPGVNITIACVVVLVTTIYFAVVSPDCRHWFLLPTAVVGIILATDLVAWVRGQVDTFDPLAFVAGTGFVGYYLAPILHRYWGVYDPNLNAIIDFWPRRFGQFTALLIPALLLYKLGHRGTFNRRRPPTAFWEIDNRRFVGNLTVALLISAAAALYIQIHFQGFHTEASFSAEVASQIGSSAWLMALEQPLGFLLVLAVLQLAFGSGRKPRTLLVAVALLAVLSVVQFMLVGYRGSRTNTVSAVLLTAGIIHYRLRRFAVWHAVVGLMILCVFMYFYGFFKKLGSAGFEALESSEARAALEEQTGFNFEAMVLGDLARADVQAFTVYRILHDRDYRFRWGLTYASNVLGFIPRAIWESKPRMVMTSAQTDIEYGEGSFDPDFFYSVKVFGLPGEAMLNFGLWGVPLAFAVYGLAFGWYRGRLVEWDPRDARFILVPLMTYIAMSFWSGNSANTVFAALVNGTLPFLVILNSVHRVPFSARPPARA